MENGDGAIPLFGRYLSTSARMPVRASWRSSFGRCANAFRLSAHPCRLGSAPWRRANRQRSDPSLLQCWPHWNEQFGSRSTQHRNERSALVEHPCRRSCGLLGANEEGMVAKRQSVVVVAERLNGEKS